MKNANNGTNSSIKEKVNALYELMKSEKLEELEIKEENFYLYLKRKGKASPAAKAPAKGPETETAEEIVPASGQTIKSPITGTFYRAPSPAAAPFVKEGDVVASGKTLCVIEAMKVMNEIKADASVRVTKIIVENGRAVTAGQDLFMVEKI